MIQSCSFFLMFISVSLEYSTFVWCLSLTRLCLPFQTLVTVDPVTYMHESCLICIDMDRNHEIEINLLFVMFLHRRITCF